MSSWKLYAIRCSQEHWYIGKSKSLRVRYEQHCSGHGADWTRLYPPLELIPHGEATDGFAEDNLVRRYMREYGIDCVRGGSYSCPILHHQQVEELERALASARDACFRCLKRGHFRRDCPLLSPTIVPATVPLVETVVPLQPTGCLPAVAVTVTVTL